LSRQQRFFTTRLCFGLSTFVFNANARSSGWAFMWLEINARRVALFHVPPTFAPRRARRARCSGQARRVEPDAVGPHWHALCFFVIRILLVSAGSIARDRDVEPPTNGASPA
jgi:hypothetical protein